MCVCVCMCVCSVWMHRAMNTLVHKKFDLTTKMFDVYT